MRVTLRSMRFGGAAMLLAAIALQPAINTAFSARSGIAGVVSCAPSSNIPDQETTHFCLQVTAHGTNVTVLLQTVRGQVCAAQAVYAPPLQHLVLSPAGEIPTLVNVKGQRVLTMDSAVYLGHGPNLGITAECSDGTGKHRNTRSVTYTRGETLAHPIAVARIALPPDATATAYVPGATLTPDTTDYHMGIGGSSSYSQPPTPTPSGSDFLVGVAVTPPALVFGDRPVLTATTEIGAICTPDVTYSTGHHPESLSPVAETVGASGAVTWTWHEETRGDAGTATVTCTLDGQTGVGATTFTVAH